MSKQENDKTQRNGPIILTSGGSMPARLFTILALIVVTQFAGVVGVLAQAPPWAVGKWAGRLESYPATDKNGPDRVLIVSASGKCQWGLPSNANPPAAANCTFTNNSMSFMTSADTTVKLDVVDSKLKGTFSLAKGRAYSIVMSKQ